MKNIFDKIGDTFKSASDLDLDFEYQSNQKTEDVEHSTTINLVDAVKTNAKRICDKIDSEIAALDIKRKKLSHVKAQHMAMYDALTKVDTEMNQ